MRGGLAAARADRARNYADYAAAETATARCKSQVETAARLVLVREELSPAPSLVAARPTLLVEPRTALAGPLAEGCGAQGERNPAVMFLSRTDRLAGKLEALLRSSAVGSRCSYGSIGPVFSSSQQSCTNELHESCTIKPAVKLSEETGMHLALSAGCRTCAAA